jgi:hypothetical protein
MKKTIGPGAPEGNNNAGKGKKWKDAIHYALAQDKKALQAIAKALIDKAKEGDVSAIKEFGDRVDGKVVQGIEGPEGGPLIVQVVKFADNSNPG